MQIDHLLKIGELSAQSGVPIKTIRYYEELGLLPSVGRTEGNYRLFVPQTLQRLAFIKRLQKLGLSLHQIKECLAIYDRGELPCPDLQHKLQAQVAQIDCQIAELLALRSELVDILAHWQPQPAPTAHICPNLSI